MRRLLALLAALALLPLLGCAGAEPAESFDVRLREMGGRPGKV